MDKLVYIKLSDKFKIKEIKCAKEDLEIPIVRNKEKPVVEIICTEDRINVCKRILLNYAMSLCYIKMSKLNDKIYNYEKLKL